MRDIILAPSFDAEFFAISSYIEDMFGILAADQFEADFKQTARRLAELPLIGTQDHGYQTDLYGFVFRPNWIFYRFTDEKIVFLHVRSDEMSKDEQYFLE
jgi:plasmid stabilization system protein ParE